MKVQIFLLHLAHLSLWDRLVKLNKAFPCNPRNVKYSKMKTNKKLKCEHKMLVVKYVHVHQWINYFSRYLKKWIIDTSIYTLILKGKIFRSIWNLNPSFLNAFVAIAFKSQWNLRLKFCWAVTIRRHMYVTKLIYPRSR